jgi:predicted aspartyl protease
MISGQLSFTTLLQNNIDTCSGLRIRSSPAMSICASVAFTDTPQRASTGDSNGEGAYDEREGQSSAYPLPPLLPGGSAPHSTPYFNDPDDIDLEEVARQAYQGLRTSTPIASTADEPYNPSLGRPSILSSDTRVENTISQLLIDPRLSAGHVPNPFTNYPQTENHSQAEVDEYVRKSCDMLQDPPDDMDLELASPFRTGASWGGSVHSGQDYTDWYAVRNALLPWDSYLFDTDFDDWRHEGRVIDDASDDIEQEAQNIDSVDLVLDHSETGLGPDLPILGDEDRTLTDAAVDTRQKASHKTKEESHRPPHPTDQPSSVNFQRPSADAQAPSFVKDRRAGGKVGGSAMLIEHHSTGRANVHGCQAPQATNSLKEYPDSRTDDSRNAVSGPTQRQARSKDISEKSTISSRPQVADDFVLNKVSVSTKHKNVSSTHLNPSKSVYLRSIVGPRNATLERTQTQTICPVSFPEPTISGRLQGANVSAFPDTGAATNYISLPYTQRHGLVINKNVQKSVKFGDGSVISIVGTATLPFSFAGETKKHVLTFHVLRNSVHDIVLGSQFLRATETFTRFAHRVGRKVRESVNRGAHRICLLGSEQYVNGLAGGVRVDAVPDTGADVSVMSAEFAKANGFEVDDDEQHQILLEFADGSTARAQGVVMDVAWEFGADEQKSPTDVYVLSSLPVDLVLGFGFLCQTEAFQEHWHNFWNIEDPTEQDNAGMFCVIRVLKDAGEEISCEYHYGVIAIRRLNI